MKKMYKIYVAVITLIIMAAASNASALTVSPAKLEISGDPGTTLRGTVELYNERDKAQTIYTSYENFESNDDTGTPRFVGADRGLATWLDSVESLTLLPNERKEVSYTITIPADAEAGGYFAAMFFGNQPPQTEGGTVSIGGRLGVLMLLRVNGDIPEDGGILDFGATDEKRFYITPPIEFLYRFSNTGGDRVAPTGTIEMHNTFGLTTDRFDANPKEGSVLPGTARKFVNTWEQESEPGEGFFGQAQAQWNDFHFGWYTAHLDLAWGVSKQTANAKYSFFIFPWQLVLLSVLVLGILFILFKLMGRRYKAALMREFEQQQAVKKDSFTSIEIDMEEPKKTVTKKKVVKKKTTKKKVSE